MHNQRHDPKCLQIISAQAVVSWYPACSVWHFPTYSTYWLSISSGAFISPISMVLSQNFKRFLFSLFFAHVCCCYLRRRERSFLLRYRSELPTTKPVLQLSTGTAFPLLSFSVFFLSEAEGGVGGGAAVTDKC